MPVYRLTVQQVQNLKALIMDADIKGSAASTIVDLVKVLDNPVRRVKKSDIHRKHNDGKKHRSGKP